MYKTAFPFRNTKKDQKPVNEFNFFKTPMSVKGWKIVLITVFLLSILLYFSILHKNAVTSKGLIRVEFVTADVAEHSVGEYDIKDISKFDHFESVSRLWNKGMQKMIRPLCIPQNKGNFDRVIDLCKDKPETKDDIAAKDASAIHMLAKDLGIKELHRKNFVNNFNEKSPFKIAEGSI